MLGISSEPETDGTVSPTARIQEVEIRVVIYQNFFLLIPATFDSAGLEVLVLKEGIFL